MIAAAAKQLLQIASVTAPLTCHAADASDALAFKGLIITEYP
jgi:hypothetical protein